MEEWKYTKSTLFVLPMLCLRVATLGFGKTFKNCYLGVDKFPELDNHIFLHYKYPVKPRHEYNKFRELEEKLMQRPEYVKTIDIGDDVLFCFKVPERFQENMLLFKQGRYSEFTVNNPNYKLLILKVWDLVVQDPLTDRYEIIANTHNEKLVDLIVPVMKREEELKNILEYNLSNYTKGNIYLDKYVSEYKLSEVKIPEQNELLSIPDEGEIFKYRKIRYSDSKPIKENKEFDNNPNDKL